MTYPEPPLAGSDIDTMIGSLERQRATFAWKCGGLDAAGLRATVGASTITLGGLLKHLAAVEDEKFGQMLHGLSPAPPFDGAGDEIQDWAWRSAADDSPERLRHLWLSMVDRSRTLLTQALATGQGLEYPLAYTLPDGTHPSLRRIMADLVEEYSRHTGHADLIREAIDGRVGEDPPGGYHEFSAANPPVPLADLLNS